MQCLTYANRLCAGSSFRGWMGARATTGAYGGEGVHGRGGRWGVGSLEGAGGGALSRGRAGEKAAAGEGAARQVMEEPPAPRRELGQAGGGRDSGLDDFFGEDPSRLFHG